MDEHGQLEEELAEAGDLAERGVAVEADFGWTRDQVSLAVSINLVCYGLIAREVGLSKNTVAGIVKRSRTSPDRPSAGLVLPVRPA